jgi:hypothetical protein
MTDLEHILAKALTGLLIDIDLSDDDIDPDIAMQLLEPMAALLQALPADRKSTLAALITICAEEETDPDRRMTALDLPNAIGIG